LALEKVENLWAITKIVVLFTSLFRESWMSFFDSASIALVASLRIRNSGGLNSAHASANLFLWPLERGAHNPRFQHTLKGQPESKGDSILNVISSSVSVLRTTGAGQGASTSCQGHRQGEHHRWRRSHLTH